LDCSEVLQQLAEFLDDDAREELCRTIEEHLSQCRDCRFQVDSVKKTIVLYQSDRSAELPVKISHQLQVALAKEYKARD
jgi:predicted anti-sigma-YlaC factor YlaD